MLASFDWTVFPAFVAMLVTAVAVAAKDFLHIRRLRRQLKNNIPLDHNKPWRKNTTWNRIGKIAVLLLYGYVMVALFSSCMSTLNRSYGYTPTEEFPGDPPFVTCSDMGEFTTENFISGYNAYNQYSTTFASTIIEWKEYGSITTEDGRILHGSLMIDYYETCSPRLARGLVDNFMYEHKKYDDFEIITSPDIDVDYVVAYHYIYPVVLIQHGNIFIRAIVSLEYQDEDILEEWACKMACLLYTSPSPRD